VVAGFNVIVFIIIAVLAHREKVQKKRTGLLEPASTKSESHSTSIEDGDEKKLAVVDIAPVSYNH
jgi:ACS family pantothenate transporter-like MFS transporter